jgi:hypothetical protein
MEVRQVRHQEIKLIKYDMPEVNIRYTGRSDSMRALDSDPVWQILLEVQNGDITVSTYALMGEFKCRWDQRSSYFSPAPTPDPLSPLGGTMAVSGTFSPTGLNIAGRMLLVTLDSTNWTPLPATPLADRNAISIQNQSLIEIKYNYDNTQVGYVGAKIAPDGERFLEIKDTIIVYAKAASGTPTILIEELS